MDKLELLVEKLKSFGQLPQPEYAAIARICIEDIKIVIGEMNDWKEKYNTAQIEGFLKLADTGNTIVYNLGFWEYTVSATKKEVKK